MTSMAKSTRLSRWRPTLWLQGMMCGALAAVAPATALMTAILLAPGLIALWADRAPGRPMGRAVMLFSLAGCVGPLHVLWSGSATMADVLTALDGQTTVLVAWMAGAVGWLLTQIAPLVVRAALDAVALSRLAALKAERARHLDAWDLTDA